MSSWDSAGYANTEEWVWKNPAQIQKNSINTFRILKRDTQGLKDSSEFFKSVLKQKSGAHKNDGTGFACCNHVSCSYWPLEDPLQMRL